jgi:hypothetical protein
MKRWVIIPFSIPNELEQNRLSLTSFLPELDRVKAYRKLLA